MTDLPSAPINAIVRPPETITETAHVVRMLWLRTLFGAASEVDEDARPIEPLAHRMTEFFIPRGAKLYEEGTTSDSLFFVVEGSIRQGMRGYTLFVPGDVLGFIDAMVDRPHRHSAVVEEDAVILRLRIDDWLEYLEDHFEAVRALLESTVRGFPHAPDDRQPEPVLKETLLKLTGSGDSTSGDFVRRLLALHSCPLFRQASIQALSQMVRISVPRALSTGERCHTTTQPGVWIVIRGSVTLMTTGPEGQPLTLHQGPGCLVHSLYTFLEIPEVFEVVAKEETELLHVTTRDLLNIMEDHFDVARSAFSYLALRLDELNESRAEGSRMRGRRAPPKRSPRQDA